MIDIGKLKIKNLANLDNAEGRLLRKYRDLQSRRFAVMSSTSQYLRPSVGEDDVIVLGFDLNNEPEMRKIALELDEIDGHLARIEGRFLEYERTCRGGRSTDKIAREIMILEEKVRRMETELHGLAAKKSIASASSRQRLLDEEAALNEKLAALKKELRVVKEEHQKLYAILN